MSCNLCEETDSNELFTKEYQTVVFKVVKCPQCGLVYVKNPPVDETLKDLYGEEFFSTGQQSISVNGGAVDFVEGARNDAIFKNAMRRFEELKKYKAGGNLLDIGCGKGIFLKVAEAHFEGTGIDISEYAAKYGNEVLGVNIINGDLLDLEFSEEHFDVVTMWDFIVHVRNPIAYVQKANILLKKGGILTVTTGDFGSLVAKIFGRNWPLMLPYMHLFYFSQRTITEMLEKSGFEVVSVGRPGKYVNISFLVSKMSRLYGLSFLQGLYNRLAGSGSFLKNVYLNLFDIMTVYARKQ